MINAQTKLIARLHAQQNGTGLNIYNPYFEAVGLDAVYLLFQDDDPARLLDGMRNLKVSGAIAAGFEHDESVPALVDEVSESVKLANRIGIIINRDGKLKAHYQGGEGLMSAIHEKFDTTDKKLVLVGAGTVAKTLLLALENSSKVPREVTIVNRTVDHGQAISERFSFVIETVSLDDLPNIKGDILINASRIGSDVEDAYFTEPIVSQYQAVADVTFGNPNTNLVALGRDSGAQAITGWDMFTHQAAVVLREILQHEADIETLRKFVAEGLSAVNHAQTPKLAKKIL